MIFNKRILLCCSIIILLSISCQKDLLDTIPTDRLSNEIFFQNEKDVEFAANAMYPTLDGVGIVAYDAITDHTFVNTAFDGENFQIQRGVMDATMNRFSNEWNNSYTGIRRANDFLHNVIHVEGNSEIINSYTAEVMAIRAYHYIKLVMLFGDVPLITTGISLSESKSIQRTPVEQIWGFIGEELEQAATWLPWDNNNRINKGTALGLKSRAMLYAGRYSDSADASERVIKSGEYSLYPSYFELFQYEGQGNSEILLTRERAKDINSHNIYASLAPYSQRTGQQGFVPTGELVDLYDMINGLPINHPESNYDPLDPYQNRDPRLEASVFLPGITILPDGTLYNTVPPGSSGGTDDVDLAQGTTKTGFNIRKYVANEDYQDYTNSGLNISLMRYAEVLLNYAEAKIEMGEIDDSVYDAINEIRQRPSVEMPKISSSDASSQSDMRDIVRKERSVELAFEGFRFFDIRRWRIGEDVMKGYPTGATYTEDGEVKQLLVTFAGERQFNPERDYLWPIPIREIWLNPNLNQNPGW